MGVLIVVIVVFFLNRVSLCSPGWPRTSYIDQAGFKPTEICMSLTPLYWSSGLELPTTPGFNAKLLILLAMLHFN